MLNLDPWSIFWTLFNVLVLYLIVRRFLVGPIMKVINQREEFIASQLDSAKTSMDQADKIRNEYQEKLKSSHAQAEEIFMTAKTRASAEYDRILAESKVEADQILEKAKQEIENEKVRAKEEVQTEIAQLAMLAARKIIKTGEIHDAGSNE
ncbi:MAG: F0F1 ATP synthase subunit B [Lachnospiraceae bacterium]